jgi:hypothetical protein
VEDMKLAEVVMNKEETKSLPVEEKPIEVV